MTGVIDRHGLHARIRIVTTATAPDGTVAARHILADLLALPIAQIRLEKDAWGRPTLAGPVAGHAEISIAHSGPFLAVGVSTQGRVGIDIEVPEANIDVDAVAREMFTADECRQLAALPDHARRDAFYYLWTAKEAYLKAIGLGLSMAMPDIELAFLAPDRLQLRRVYGHAELATGWALWHERLAWDGHTLLLAVVEQER